MNVMRMFGISDEAFSPPTKRRRRRRRDVTWEARAPGNGRLNENSITHNEATALLSARLPAYSNSLTTKTVSPDLASDVHSKLDTSVWLSITAALFGVRAAPPSFLPFSALLKENNSGVINHGEGSEPASG